MTWKPREYKCTLCGGKTARYPNCRVCLGTGILVRCRVCSGTGRQPLLFTLITCTNCNGTGALPKGSDDPRCGECGRSG